MIIVTSASKPLAYTPKGTVRRQACIDEYEAEINAAYDAFEESSQADMDPPAAWDLDGIKDFVKRVVSKVMGETTKQLADESDLFELGLDRQVTSTTAAHSTQTIIQSSSDLGPEYYFPRYARAAFEYGAKSVTEHRL